MEKDESTKKVNARNTMSNERKAGSAKRFLNIGNRKRWECKQRDCKPEILLTG